MLGTSGMTVMDQATPLGQTKTVAVNPLQSARYIRVTDYESHAGALVELEVHATPSSRGVLMLAR